MDRCAEASFLESALRDFRGDPQLTVHRVTCEPACGKAKNFLSVVRRVTVTGSLGVGENRGFLCSVIVKRQLPDPLIRASLHGDQAFSNEIHAYSEIIPSLNRLSQQQPLAYPRCLFGGQDHSRGDVLVLEDLRESGFSPLAPDTPLTLAHCQLVLQKFAHLHATGMVLRIVDGGAFERAVDCLEDFHFRGSSQRPFAALFEASTKRTLESLRQNNGDGRWTHVMQLIERHLSGGQLFRRLQAIVVAEAADPALTLCHGDSWLNNVLFRNDAEGGVEDARFVDLQLMRHASPTTDLLHFLFSSTDTAFRRKHYEELLNGYQQCLAAWIDRLAGPHLQAEGVRGRVDQLKEEHTLDRLRVRMHRNCLYGLGQCLLLLPVATMTYAELLELDRGTEYPEEFHRRTRETVLEFCEMGVLSESFLEDIPE